MHGIERVFLLFIIISGSKVTYSSFADGQGNNHDDGFFFANGGTEDCAVLRRDDGGKWHDYHCESIVGNVGYHFTYICEFRKSTIVFLVLLFIALDVENCNSKLLNKFPYRIHHYFHRFKSMILNLRLI